MKNIIKEGIGQVLLGVSVTLVVSLQCPVRTTYLDLTFSRSVMRVWLRPPPGRCTGSALSQWDCRQRPEPLCSGRARCCLLVFRMLYLSDHSR